MPESPFEMIEGMGWIFNLFFAKIIPINQTPAFLHGLAQSQKFFPKLLPMQRSQLWKALPLGFQIKFSLKKQDDHLRLEMNSMIW